MGLVVDMTGKVVTQVIEKHSSLEIQDILDNLSALNKAGELEGLAVSCLHRNGVKSRAWAIDSHVDPMTVLGTLEMLKEQIKRQMITMKV